MYRTFREMLGGIMVVTETDLVDLKKNKKTNEKDPMPTQKATNGLSRTMKAVNEWEANASKSNYDLKDESDWECWTIRMGLRASTPFRIIGFTLDEDELLDDENEWCDCGDCDEDGLEDIIDDSDILEILSGIIDDRDEDEDKDEDEDDDV